MAERATTSMSVASESTTITEEVDGKTTEVFSDPHVKDIKLVQEMKLASGTSVKFVGPPVDYSASKNAARGPPPDLGEHTREILSAVLNYPEDKIKALFDRKAVQ